MHFYLKKKQINYNKLFDFIVLALIVVKPEVDLIVYN